jgi:hypothetical protein
MIALAFTIVCAAVFVAAALTLARGMLTARRITLRMRAMVPYPLLAQSRLAPLDIKRISVAFKQLGAIAPRAAMAAASIMRSVHTYLALLARLRNLAS